MKNGHEDSVPRLPSVAEVVKRFEKSSRYDGVWDALKGIWGGKVS